MKFRNVALLALAILTTTAAFSASRTFTNIDQMSGWQSCSTCAGANGAGPTVSHSMRQNVSSPSMDGRSAQFNLGASSRFANALWWKQLGANSGVSNFVYDLYFYIKNPGASQALEFDVNQSFGGHKYIFGTQCNIAANKWDIYDAAGRRWVHTSVGCSRPSAYKWHHVILEFKRASGRMAFVTVTMDGVKHYLGKTYAPRAGSASEVNIAFQMDGNATNSAYTTWLDKVKLTYW
jgi:hypothetical protein